LNEDVIRQDCLCYLMERLPLAQTSVIRLATESIDLPAAQN
jgi:hypothetical protein